MENVVTKDMEAPNLFFAMVLTCNSRSLRPVEKSGAGQMYLQ